MNIKDHIRISTGNSKVGKIYNISLPPIKTCIDDPPCAEDCYALRSYNRWNIVRNAWDLNFNTYKNYPELYFNSIDFFLKETEPEYFRWHVSGDIPDEYYLFKIVRMALVHKDIKFMLFTKKYDYIEYYDLRTKYKAENLKIILSAWKGMDLPELNHSIAFIEDDDRKTNYIKCKGKCDECFECWNLDSGTNLCLKKL